MKHGQEQLSSLRVEYSVRKSGVSVGEIDLASLWSVLGLSKGGLTSLLGDREFLEWFMTKSNKIQSQCAYYYYYVYIFGSSHLWKNRSVLEKDQNTGSLINRGMLLAWLVLNSLEFLIWCHWWLDLSYNQIPFQFYLMSLTIMLLMHWLYWNHRVFYKYTFSSWYYVFTNVV